MAYVQNNIEGNEDLTEELAAQLIADFDGDNDGLLDANEFGQMILPGANNSARDIAEARTESSGDFTQQLAAFLLDEFNYQRKITELREALAGVESFDMEATFRRLGTKAYGIDILNLQVFVERASVYLTRAHTDSILRRFNHSNTGRVEYSEYYELVTGTQYVENAQVENSADDEEVKDEASPAKDAQSPEAGFDEYASPLPADKDMEANELKSSKAKEVRIAEEKNTTAPARKLDLEDNEADAKKETAATSNVSHYSLNPYIRARQLAEEDYRRRREEYYARIEADRKLAQERYERIRAEDEAN